jgi:hypothetical protein
MVRSAASVVTVVAMRQGGGHQPRANAARLVRERLGAEAGAINSRQLGGGFADYPAGSREGVAGNSAGARHEVACGLVVLDLRRYSGANPAPASGTTRASCRAQHADPCAR